MKDMLDIIFLNDIPHCVEFGVVFYDINCKLISSSDVRISFFKACMLDFFVSCEIVDGMKFLELSTFWELENMFIKTNNGNF